MSDLTKLTSALCGRHHALLKATGEPFEVQYFPGQHGNDWWEVAIHRADDGLSAKGFGQGSDLTTAAEMAVNEWKKRKDVTP